MSYHSDNLIEAANCLNNYIDLENELIKLAGKAWLNAGSFLFA